MLCELTTTAVLFLTVADQPDTRVETRVQESSPPVCMSGKETGVPRSKRKRLPGDT